MPSHEAPCVELGSAPETSSIAPSPSPSEISSTSSPEPQNIRATPLFRMLAMPPPEPEQPPGQEELERRLPGYRRIVIPRELTLIELLKQCSGAVTDEDVLRIREAKLRVIAERVGLRRIHVLAPRLRSLTLDGSALPSLRDLGIGLVKLKFLSVNRCTLTSLDGVWGLSALRELHASGNRLQDLQPLAVLQKLHTLNLNDNPISESSRLWTLAVCSSLRKLSLGGSPASRAATYRSQVASVLPMLTHLDDRPLHNDVEYDTDVFGAMSSSSDSEEENAPEEKTPPEPLEPEPGPSTSKEGLEQQFSKERSSPSTSKTVSNIQPRRRPATTECSGERPERPRLAARPHTAHEASRPAPPSRLEFMNTLLDEEWRCSGSSLTSRGPVCGNLARALRRQNRNSNMGVETDMAEQTMAGAARSIAAEIPRAPRLEDWAKFKEDTGIEIEIDFNERPKGIDPNKAMDRLEMIERETRDRFKDLEKINIESGSDVEAERSDEATSRITRDEFYIDYEMWRQVKDFTVEPQPQGNVDDIFGDMAAVQSMDNEIAK